MESSQHKRRAIGSGRLARLIGSGLGDGADGRDLAQAAHYSRSHFQHWFLQQTGETPGACRRRLRLESAAFRLLHEPGSVTDQAFDCGYSSLEGFSRAFSRSFGVSPSHFQRLHPVSWFLAAPNDIHYDPVMGAAIRLTEKAPKGGVMDLTDRLVGHDYWLSSRLLEQTASLGDDQLDQPLKGFESGLLYTSEDKTLREMINRLIFTKEVWMSAIHGRPMPDYSDNSPETMRRRLEAAYGEFIAIVDRVRDEDLWDTEFMHMLRQPPEIYTYGGMIAHVLNFSAYRRTQLVEALESFGVQGLNYGDPMAWEREQPSRQEPSE